jgi:hypothetical protein
LKKTAQRFWVLKQPNKAHDKIMILKPRRRDKKLECHGRKDHEDKTLGSVLLGLVYAHECAMLANFCIHDTKKILVDALGTLRNIEIHVFVSPKCGKYWVTLGTIFESGDLSLK